MVHFDWTINFGNVLSAVVLFGGFYMAHVQNLKRIDRIESQLELVFEWFKANIINRKGDL